MRTAETWSGEQVESESVPNAKDPLGAGLVAWLRSLKTAA
jgi:hypothetical protein